MGQEVDSLDDRGKMKDINGGDGRVPQAFIQKLIDREREVWRVNPDRARKDARQERRIVDSGYSDRQILELIQNAADAAKSQATARVEFLLAGKYLYASNTGEAVSENGFKALVMGELSPKEGEDEDGRFGMGFRSLLRFGGTVDVFSAGVGLRFDPERCEKDIRTIAGLAPDEPAPRMQLAWLTDTAGEAATDPNLAELMEWADTIVRVAIPDTQAHELAIQAAKRFSPEFLLFAKSEIHLKFSGFDAPDKIYSRKPDGNDVLLESTGSKPARWRVVSERFLINSAAARADMGDDYKPEHVRISWAVPLDAMDPPTLGFWRGGFRLDNSDGVIPGILNAPWKVNSDRSALNSRAWNDELMRLAGQMIANALPSLVRSDDPGFPVALLPKRPDGGKATPVWPLAQAVWQSVLDVPFLADGTGKPCQPGSLERPPWDDGKAQAEWERLVDDEVRVRLVHHSTLSSRDRVSRLKRLAKALAGESPLKSDDSWEDDEDDDVWIREDEIEDDAEEAHRPCLGRMSADQWLEICAKPDPDSSRSAVMLAQSLLNRSEDWNIKQSAKQAAIILGSDGALWSGGQLFLPGPGEPIPGLVEVHPDLAIDEAVRKVLVEHLGVQEASEDSWRKALEEAFPATGRRWSNTDRFERGWQLLARAPADVRKAFINTFGNRILVRCADGEWRHRLEVLRVGAIIDAVDAPKFPWAIVDPAFENGRKRLLDQLGVKDTPSEVWAAERDPAWASEPAKAACKHYIEDQPQARSAQRGTIGYVGSISGPPAAGLLPRLSGRPAAALTRILLEKHLPRVSGPVSVGGRGVQPTQLKYPPIPAPHPLAVLLWDKGKWKIGDKIAEVAGCWNVCEQLAQAGASSEEIKAVELLLPTRGSLDKIWPDGWLGYKSDTEPVWKALLAAGHTRDHAELRPLWRAAARFQHLPGVVPFGDQDIPIHEIVVVRTETEAAMGASAGYYAVLLDEQTAQVWIEAGAKDIHGLTEVVVVDLQSDPVRPGDLVPGIDEYLLDKAFIVQFARRIVSRLGQIEEPLSYCCEDDRLVLNKEQWDSADGSWRTRTLIEALDRFDVLVEGVKVGDLLEELDLVAAMSLRKEIAKHPDLPARLLAAAGSAKALIDSLPFEAAGVIEDGTDDLEIAELALDIHGCAALRTLGKVLDERGLRPPLRWGTSEARTFVAELGFPPEFAGAGNPKLMAEIDVDGPLRLGELHDYQKEALHQLASVFLEPGAARRAVLSLPTGAGKTRVAVEAAIANVLNSDAGRPLIVWIAQTEELGEQAVEAFRQVWRNKGLENKTLRVCRLWRGLRTPQPGLDDQPTVIVALFQTLDRRLEEGSAGWLSAASLLVVDECHHATAPSYTSILNGLGFATGAGLRRREDRRAAEPVLLGLSATPFRSAGDEESRLLAQRFGNRVLPSNQAGLYERLEEQGILSKIDYLPIEMDCPSSEHLAQLAA